MKVIFNRSEIIASASPLLCAVSGKNTLAATEGILIKTAEDGNACTLTSFDLEKGMITEVSAQVEEPGCVVINAQKFIQTMKVMDGEEVELEVDAKFSATISCGNSRHKMGAIDGSNFPQLPNLYKTHGFTIAQGVLRDMLTRASYAMASRDERPALNGCFVWIEETKLTVVSCDSFKLAKIVASAEMENKSEDGGTMNFKFIIPVHTVNELTHLLSDSQDEKVTIYPGRKNIEFQIGDLIMFSRLIDTEYIDYNRIIGQNHRITLTTDRQKLIGALERAALVTEERIAGNLQAHVKLCAEGDLLQITAVSVTGSTFEEVEVAHEGDSIAICFNNRFLIDSLRSCEGDNVKLSLSTPLSSMNIQPGDEENSESLYMLLPVRTKD